MTQPLPKTALITGAAKRLGRHIALEMARQGWNIIVHLPVRLKKLPMKFAN